MPPAAVGYGLQSRSADRFMDALHRERVAVALVVARDLQVECCSQSLRVVAACADARLALEGSQSLGATVVFPEDPAVVAVVRQLAASRASADSRPVFPVEDAHRNEASE